MRLAVCALVALAALTTVASALALPRRPVAPGTFPLVINTWPFTNATSAAFQVISTTKTPDSTAAKDAVVAGCTTCEVEQCDGSVGYGGSPDENGETTLDAMIMDGTTMDVGSVGALRYVKNAIGVARAVLEYTTHTLIVGDQATAFAASMGFPQTNLSTPQSEQIYETWKQNNCQPNYWRDDVEPSPTTSCGPYAPLPPEEIAQRRRAKKNEPHASRQGHDTIAMIVIDQQGENIVSGTSTNGATHKIAGRVGDSPVAGAGSFADSTIGGCGATGDGDTMMRFLPCYQAVESMRQGMSPQDAADDAIARIEKYYPNFVGAIVVVNAEGEYAGACHGWNFSFSVVNPLLGSVQVVSVPPLSKERLRELQRSPAK